MDVRITIANDDGTEIINAENIADPNCFSYKDSYGASCLLTVYDDGITIDRKGEEHSTLVVLRAFSYIEINSDLGKLEFDVKRLAFEENDDNIFIAYTVNDTKTVLRIEYLGGKQSNV